MRWVTSIATAAIIVSTAAHAQTAPVTGMLGSASVQSAKDGPTTIITTPLSGRFVLTRFCANGACTSFKPGFVLPQDEQIQCAGNGTPCSITWLLER